MPLDQCEAIILRSFPLADQDKIIVFFSPEKGLMRGIAKGARKFGNRFGSSLEPMSLVRVFFYEKERKDLVTVNSCDLIESFFEIQKEPKTAFTLAYFAELIEEFFPSRSSEEIVFRLLHRILVSLKEKGDLDFLSRYFEAWFLQANGFLPNFKKCKKCGIDLPKGGWLSPKKDGIFCDGCARIKKEETEGVLNAFLDWVKKNPPPTQGFSPIPPQNLEQIRKTLQGIIIFHLEREPKSLQLLKEWTQKPS